MCSILTIFYLIVILTNATYLYAADLSDIPYMNYGNKEKIADESKFSDSFSPKDGGDTAKEFSNPSKSLDVKENNKENEDNPKGDTAKEFSDLSESLGDKENNKENEDNAEGDTAKEFSDPSESLGDKENNKENEDNAEGDTAKEFSDPPKEGFSIIPTDFNSTSPQPPNQQSPERKTKESLTSISQQKKDSEILNQVYALIDAAPNSTQIIVNDLILAIYVPDNTTETNDTDLIWQFREQNSSNEIDIKLHHEIVNHMKSESIDFRIILLKHSSDSSFETKTRHGRILKHGPFIIVKTTSEDEISTGAPALEFEMDRKHLDPPKGKWNCRFWNNRTGEWEKRGIKTVKYDKCITCISDHLSAFSIVMDPYYGTEDDDEILTIVSVLSSLLTIPCMIITILLHCHKRARRNTISSKILINCCLSLLLLHISFLIYTSFLQIFPCWLLNFLVHYGLSSALLWTAADGINMWRKLFIDIFDKKKTVFYRSSKIISWGFPLATSLVGILTTDYTKKNECGIYFEHNMLLYLLPCAMVLICNVIFFTIMFINVVCKDKIKHLTHKKKKYVMSLVQVFGLFWCISFPLLWLAETRLFGHIIFAVLVANQGVVIFILRCMNEKEIRRELTEYTLCRKKFRRVSTTTDDERSVRVSKRSKVEVTKSSAMSADSSM